VTRALKLSRDIILATLMALPQLTTHQLINSSHAGNLGTRSWCFV